MKISEYVSWGAGADGRTKEPTQQISSERPSSPLLFFTSNNIRIHQNPDRHQGQTTEAETHAPEQRQSLKKVTGDAYHGDTLSKICNGLRKEFEFPVLSSHRDTIAQMCNFYNNFAWNIRRGGGSKGIG